MKINDRELKPPFIEYEMTTGEFEMFDIEDFYYAVADSTGKMLSNLEITNALNELHALQILMGVSDDQTKKED